MTRDEAIGRIKARFDKWALDDEDMKAIQTLIPELAESEDERIIKTIRQLLETARDAHSNTSLAKPFVDALAWLEKQKENIEKEYVFRPLAGTDITIAAKQAIRKADEGDRLVLAFNGAYIPVRKGCNTNKIVDIYDAFIEKQKEKSEIPIMDGDTDTYFDDLRMTTKPLTSREWFDEGIKYAQKLQKEQKPAEWSEEDKKKLERVDDLLWMLDDYLGNDCSICEEKTARLRDEIHNELFPWLEFLRPQYHGDVTMTEAYKMGLEAGKASSWKPSEKQTNNVIVELTRIELGDIINGLYYLKEKYYEDCKEHNGTATMGLSDEFKFYFKRFNEVLDLYTRLHELEKEKYGTTTDGYYYE